MLEGVICDESGLIEKGDYEECFGQFLVGPIMIGNDVGAYLHWMQFVEAMYQSIYIQLSTSIQTKPQ
jgi:hypothetical protein